MLKKRQIIRKMNIQLTCADDDGFALAPSGILGGMLGTALGLALATSDGFVVGNAEIDGLTVASRLITKGMTIPLCVESRT